MARKAPRATVNTAGKPRPTKLKANVAPPASKGAAKPSTLVKGMRGSTGTR